MTPTSIIPSCVGFTAQSDTNGLIKACFTVPAGMLLNAGFILLWRHLPAKLPLKYTKNERLIIMVIITVFAWIIAAFLFVIIMQFIQSGDQSIISVVVGILFFIIQLLTGIFLVYLKPKEAPKGKSKVPFLILLCRGFLAGIVVSVAVLLSKFNDIAAAMISIFPAIMLTSMISLWLSHGEQITVGAAGPMLTGTLSVSAYAMLFSIIEPYVGIIAAPFICYTFSITCFSIPIVLLLRHSEKKFRSKELAKDTSKTEIDTASILKNPEIAENSLDTQNHITNNTADSPK